MQRVLLCLLLVWAAACTPARREAEGNIVRYVSFEGNEGLLSGHNDYQLRTQMQQSYTGFGVTTWPLMYFKNPEVLRGELLPRDAYRLEVWYAHHGWLDARVEGWALRKVRDPRPKRAGVLDIRGYVDPGEPSVLRTLSIEGTSPTLTAVIRAVERSAPIREGDQFDLELVEQTQQLLLDKLKNQARAYATAELSITALPEEHAVDVVLNVDEGPVCRFGDITIEGNEDVPTELISQRLTIEPGEGYKIDTIRDTQQALFEMGTFSVVTVEPDLSDRSVKEVPIRVTVTESSFRRLRIGGGVSYDGFLLQPRVSSRVRHVNLFHSLMRAELGARAGLAYGVTGGTLSPRLPTFGVDLSVTYPRIARQKVAIELRGEFEQDIYAGLWAYRRPQADLGVLWRYSEDVTLRAGPHVEQYTFLSDYGRRIENAQRRLFGIEDAQEDFTYQLTALDQAITWDYRNDELSTTRGSYYSVQAREAIPLSESGYAFVRGSAEGRWWAPLRLRRRGTFPFVLAGKLRGTAIFPLGDKAIPVPERAYLGGANSIRGFRPNQVGPYTTLCTVEEYETNTGGLLGLGGGETETVERVQQFHLPEGGNLAVEGSFEVHYDWIYGIKLATFVDAGVLSPQLLDPQGWLEGFRASAGVGARYDTLVGPFRFDLSFRPLYPEDDGPLRYAGNQCDPADEQPRIYDFFSNFPGLRGDNHPPFAMVFFLTIGEAF